MNIMWYTSHIIYSLYVQPEASRAPGSGRELDRAEGLGAHERLLARRGRLYIRYAYYRLHIPYIAIHPNKNIYICT